MHRRSVTFSSAIALVLGLASPAAAQVFAPTARVEVAEVRGLDVIPSDFAQGFAAAVLGAVFEPSVRTIFVRFQASKSPQGEKLFVTWSAVPESGPPVALQRTPADTGSLASGLVDALTNGGRPLAHGRYIVALVGPDEHVYRSLEFRVGPPPVIAAGPVAAPRLEKVYFDQYSLTYPATFTPQPVVVGMTGMFLRRTAPFGLMFAVLGDPRADSIVPQAREIAQVMLGRLESGRPPITNAREADIPADRLAPGMIVGKVLEVPFRQGMLARASFYSKDVEGRRVLFGYVTITGNGVPAEYEQLLTTDPDALSEDFFRMVASFKGGTPLGPKTPGEDRP